MRIFELAVGRPTCRYICVRVDVGYVNRLELQLRFNGKTQEFPKSVWQKLGVAVHHALYPTGACPRFCKILDLCALPTALPAPPPTLVQAFASLLAKHQKSSRRKTRPGSGGLGMPGFAASTSWHCCQGFCLDGPRSEEPSPNGCGLTPRL